MVQHESLKEGMTVTRPYTVVKINPKSIVIEDSKGERISVRERDYDHYFKGVQAKSLNGYNKEPKKTTPKTAMPKWADTKEKQRFVTMSRKAGDNPTMKGFKDWKKSK